MVERFKMWSEISPSAKKTLKPQLDLRSWDDLNKADKAKIIKHLRRLGWLNDKDKIISCVSDINSIYKVKTFAAAFFDHGGPHYSYQSYATCCEKPAFEDFVRIIFNEPSDVVLELLSLYAQTLIQQYYLNKASQTEDDVSEAYNDFDRFSNAVNEVFDQFAVNLKLSRQGFLPKQEKIVEEYVHEPLIKGLADKKWQPVQQELADAISEYHKSNEKSYSNSITHLSSALQAFLQIKINGSIGKGDIDSLIRTGMNNGAIPNDELSKKVINGLKSTLMEYRQKSGDAHPKKEYANEKSVRLVLNVVAVFIQHCL